MLDIFFRAMRWVEHPTTRNAPPNERTFNEAVVAFILENAPEHAARLLSNESFALQSLKHPDANVRLSAFKSCFHLWKLASHPEFVDRCVHVCDKDDTEVMRLAATVVVLDAYRGTGDRHAKRALARLVSNAELSANERIRSYYALWLIEHGNDAEIRAEVREAFFEQTSSMTGIDWTFVRASSDDAQTPTS